MSVLRSVCIRTFVAPVSVFEDTISLTGSWSSVFSPKADHLSLGPDWLCHYRIHSWNQTNEKKQNITFCLDWSVHKLDGQIRFEIELKVASVDKSFRIDDQIILKIQTLLNKHKIQIRKLQGIFQQAQPGAFLEDSVMGRAGSDGASQSV